MEYAVQQFMRHQRQWQFELVILEKFAVIKHFLGGSFRNDPAVCQHKAAITDLQGDIKVMRTEQDSFIRFFQPLDQLTPVHWVHIRGWLIEYQYFRLV